MRTPPPVIRPAAPTDAAALATLLTQLGYPSPAADLPRRLAALDGTGRAIALVAERDGEVLGLVTAHLLHVLTSPGPLAELTALVVADGARGEGIGRHLVGAVEEFARRHGCAKVMVTSTESRAGAHAFYASVGWHYSGRRFTRELTRPASRNP